MEHQRRRQSAHLRLVNGRRIRFGGVRQHGPLLPDELPNFIVFLLKPHLAGLLKPPVFRPQFVVFHGA